MSKVVLYFLPATGVIAAIFGAFYVWIAIAALRNGAGWVGVLLLVFGFAGIALGAALWNAWRMMLARARGR